MKETILSRISGWIDENSAILADANNAIWEFAETAFNEKCSSAYLKQVLEQYGFRILPGARVFRHPLSPNGGAESR